MRTACKPSRHNFEKYIRRKCVYCLEQSKQRKHAGCATVKGGHIQKELVSALITSTPVNILLQAKHYHQNKLWTLCTSVNNWSHCSPGILKHRSQKSLIWKGPVDRGQVWGISPIPPPAQSRDSINCAKYFLRVSFSQVWLSPRKKTAQPLWATCGSASPSAVKTFPFIYQLPSLQLAFMVPVGCPAFFFYVFPYLSRHYNSVSNCSKTSFKWS